jgi:hypothetical protein
MVWFLVGHDSINFRWTRLEERAADFLLKKGATRVALRTHGAAQSVGGGRARKRLGQTRDPSGVWGGSPRNFAPQGVTFKQKGAR